MHINVFLYGIWSMLNTGKCLYTYVTYTPPICLPALPRPIQNVQCGGDYHHKKIYKQLVSFNWHLNVSQSSILNFQPKYTVFFHRFICISRSLFIHFFRLFFSHFLFYEDIFTIVIWIECTFIEWIWTVKWKIWTSKYFGLLSSRLKKEKNSSYYCGWQTWLWMISHG